MRKCVYDGSPARAPGTVRREAAGWLAVVREVSRALFPEEPARRHRAPLGEGRPAN